MEIHSIRPAVRRTIAGMLAGAALAALAACGGSTPPAVSPTFSQPPSTASITPSFQPTPTPGPTAVTFTSPAYRYVATFPAGLLRGRPAPAADPWDGTARIDSTGPRTDAFQLQDSRLMFAYGAPTDLPLADFAAAGQRQKAEWHGCPAQPDQVEEASLAGSPALLYDFECGGLHLLSLYVVRDGFGLVVNLMSPPGDPDTDRARLIEWLGSWAWQS